VLGVVAMFNHTSAPCLQVAGAVADTCQLTFPFMAADRIVDAVCVLKSDHPCAKARADPTSVKRRISRLMVISSLITQRG
jgi:hypothetical protein